MNSSFNEYMSYCSDQDNAGYLNIEAKVNPLLDSLDGWKEQEDLHAMRPTKYVEVPFKRNRGDYQYGKS